MAHTHTQIQFSSFGVYSFTSGIEFCNHSENLLSIYTHNEN